MTRKPIPPEYLTAPQAAEYLGTSLPWLRAKTREGVVPAVYPGGRAVRYSRSELDAFMRSNGRGSA